jgi:hypothetical protein
MRVLDELEREFERVAREGGEARPRRRWWRSSVALVLLPLCIGTVAVAATATGVLSGEPVKPPPGLKPDPASGFGVVVGAGKIFDVQPPDPAGGPPWAMRYVKTSRGFGCVQVGRLVDGKIGVLGRDGAFDDDGRFHELGAEVRQHGFDCRQTDAAGHAFLAVNHTVPASATLRDGCVNGNECPTEVLRQLIYGLLGPDAVAVTYLDANGQAVRQPVSRPEGAYLVVKPETSDRPNLGRFSVGTVPVSGLTGIEYRDGSVCRIGRAGGTRRCPVRGFAAPALDRVTRAQLRTPIRVRVGRRPETPAGVPKGVRLTKQRKVTLTFRARVDADARNSFTVTTQMVKGGRDCGGGSGGAISRDIKAGTIVKHELWVPYRCRNAMRINVGFLQQTKPSGLPFQAGPAGNAKVGTRVVRLG